MLYILATPLGNLGDLSERARQLLSSVPLIIAENPAYSQRLLQHIGAQHKPKFIQFAEHNEHSALPKAIAELRERDAVLISDAGTPGISDPGFRIVREAVRQGIPVSPVPGPSAAIAALSASGLPTNTFVFLGFVPKTEIKFTSEISRALKLEGTVIFYESPHRISKTLAYIAKSWPEAQVVIARELTKIHEEFLRGTARELAHHFANQQPKGEFVILINNHA